MSFLINVTTKKVKLVIELIVRERGEYLMKKSNALMLSYIIFLCIAVGVDILSNWQGMDQIALAATVAGCFFAFADLSNWYASYTLPIAEAMKEDYDVFCTYYQTAINAFRTNKTEASEVIVLMEPFIDKDERIADAVTSCKKVVESATRTENQLVEMNSDIERIGKDVDNELSKVDRYEKIEVILAVLGFLVFFALITFDCLTNILSAISSLATVFAFIIIMLNYFLREFLEDKAKQDIADINAHMEQEKENIKEIEEKKKMTDALEHARNVAKKYKTASEKEVMQHEELECSL